MTYRSQLYPWCIVRILPNCQCLVVARCRRRNEAENHAQVLKLMTPTATYVIVFDLSPQPEIRLDSWFGRDRES